VPTPEPTDVPTPEITPEPTEEPTQIPTDFLPTPTTEYLVDVIVPTSGEIIPDHFTVALKPEHKVRGNEEAIESALNAYGG
jgi:hypothetical protein